MTAKPYAVRFTARAARDLARMPEKVAAACVEFIYGPLIDNPYRLGKPLLDEWADHHSARRGAYRVVYRIYDDEVVVDFVRCPLSRHQPM